MSTTEQTKPPVQVSGEAHRILGDYVRRWSGWSDAGLTLGPPPEEAGSPWAATHMAKRQMWVNVDELSLNPNRVLLSVNPFRMRQEAVLTGALLHEAAHARYSTWKPRTEEEIKNFRHVDGSAVTGAEMSLAMLIEEGRVEGRMAHEAAKNGALGFEWTMMAMALHLFPVGSINSTGGQHVMDVIGEWLLRAGRRYALSRAGVRGTTGFLPKWALDYNKVLEDSIIEYCVSQGDTVSVGKSRYGRVALLLERGLTWVEPGEVSPELVGVAKEIYSVLFPETDEQPQPNTTSCSAASDSEGGDEKGESAGSGDDGDSGDGDSGEEGSAETSDAGKILAQAAAQGAKQEAQQQVSTVSATPPGVGTAGELSEPGALKDVNVEGTSITGWRTPSVRERESSQKAGKFLRDLVDPTETSATTISDAPSALVDATALSVWKAGGRERAPRFFAQTRRDVQPAPPVKIAILVDVSMSMNVLAQPSAVLSWALSSAALDLQNFAGRGTQVESTLIHWGDKATVIQPNGKTLPGIANHNCPDGTQAMDEAMELVEQQMPGFFDPAEPGREVNRLLIQFTDWGLSVYGGFGSRGRAPSPAERAAEKVQAALTNGVKMLTFAPPVVSPFVRTVEDQIIPPALAHLHTRVAYDPTDPDKVWAVAAQALSR